MDNLLVNGNTGVDASTLSPNITSGALVAQTNTLYDYVQNENDKLDGFVKTQDETSQADDGATNEVAAKIENTQNAINAAQEQIANLTQQIEKLANELKEEQAKLENAANEREALENQFTANSTKYTSIVEDIENATKKLETNAKAEQQRIIYQAMADYNEEEDGDWGAYLEDKLGEMDFGGSTLSLIESLKGKSSTVATELGTLKTKLANKDLEIKALNANISNLTTEITSLNETKGVNEASFEKMQSISKTNKISSDETLTGGIEELKKLVSEEEWALVEENNIDLTEKNEDGSPRYIFVKPNGAERHYIYDTNWFHGIHESKLTGISLARKYAIDPKKGLKITPNGYGCLFGVDLGNKNAEKLIKIPTCSIPSCNAFFLNDNCEIESKKICCHTDSPLSFDLDGDGVDTSDKVIDYDIDGDGKIDKINDSKDAVLVFDKDGDGVSGEDGSECFGNNTDLDGDGKKDNFKDGFEALKALAQKEGLVGNGDSKLDENDLAKLEEKYGLKIKKDGYNSEAQSLASVGITEINISNSDTVMNKNFDGKGNDLMTQQGATFKINGEEREYADIWHKKQDENETNSSANTSSLSFDLKDYDTSYVEELINQTPEVADETKINTDYSSTEDKIKKSISKFENILKKYGKK